MKHLATTADGSHIVIIPAAELRAIATARDALAACDATALALTIRRGQTETQNPPPETPKPAPAQPPQPPVTGSAKPAAPPKPAKQPAPKPNPRTAPAKPRRKPPASYSLSKIMRQVILDAGKPLTITQIVDAIKDDPRLAHQTKLTGTAGMRLAQLTKHFRRVAPATYDITDRPPQIPPDAKLTSVERTTLNADPADLTSAGKEKRLELIRRLAHNLQEDAS